jgi:hypothetical protein
MDPARICTESLTPNPELENWRNVKMFDFCKAMGDLSIVGSEQPVNLRPAQTTKSQ